MDVTMKTPRDEVKDERLSLPALTGGAGRRLGF